MKKSLVIISFAFIFLLSVSIVSASWLSDLFFGKSSGEILTSQVAADGSECSIPPCPMPSYSQINADDKIRKTSAGVTSAGTNTLTKRTIPGMEGRRPTATRTAKSPSMLNCPADWDAKSARDGGSYCAPNSGDGNPRACVTVCSEPECTSYGPAPAGWCCICTGYSQSCTSMCGGDDEVVEVEETVGE